MSQKIDPREVLTLLNKLGYTNIDAQQLKDFIADLKKLIKYENKHRDKENIDLISPIESKTYDTTPFGSIHNIQSDRLNKINNKNDQHDNFISSNNEANASPPRVEQNDIFNHLYSQHTVASRAKEIHKKEKHISVVIRRHKNKSDQHGQCVCFGKDPGYSNEPGDVKVIENNIETVSDGSKLYINTESTIRSVQPHFTSNQSLTTKVGEPKKKTKSSLIRTSSFKPINKCDPVALYHYYQQQWKKQKFPGQENHSDLRWAVREKLLGGPRIQVHTLPAGRRCNSWKA